MSPGGTLVVGDVHGCAQELRELVGRAVDRCGHPLDVVLVGDLFTKGPDPVGVWRWLMQTGARAVLGNHDQRLLDVADGLRPQDQHGHAVCQALTAADPSWLPWVRALPLWRRIGDTVITHAALHPSGDLSKTDRRTHLYRRRWPNDAPGEPFWWQVYEGPPVIFGHDARRGLVEVRRDGAPWVVGLDSGCVYGGQLSGWWIEGAELVQVAAKRAYKEV